MDARDKFKSNKVTQRLNSSVVGERGMELAEDLESFMSDMMVKYKVEKNALSGLIVHYLLTDIDE